MSIAYDEGMVLTNEGRALEAERRAAGKGLHFSRAVFGSGMLPEDVEHMEDMESMVHEEMNLPWLRAVAVGDGTAKMVFYLDNSKVPAPGFPIREIGVFAKTSDDEDAEEILYSYTNFGDHYGWMPSPTSARVVATEFSLSIIVGYTTKITVDLDKELSAFALVTELEAHTEDKNAHPNLPHYGDDIVEPDKIENFWTEDGSGTMQKADLGVVQKAILGGDASSLPLLTGRLSQAEQEIMNLNMALLGFPHVIVSSTEPLDPTAYWLEKPDSESSLEGELFKIMGMSNMVIYDNFNPVTETDTLQVKVNAITAGSRTVGVESLSGIHPGSFYTITDGVSSELVQVKSSSKNGNVLRILVTADIAKVYNLDRTYIYRTTAGLKNGSLMSSFWHPGEEIVFEAKNFKADGIRALAYAESMIRHGKLSGVKIRSCVSFQDEVTEKKDVPIGVGTGSRQTIQLSDSGIDYTTIHVYANGAEIEVDANTETTRAEVTLTAAEGAAITASYNCGLTDEDWREMDCVSVQEYGDSGIIATRFEYSLPEGETEKTRTCIKWVLDAEDDSAQPAMVYGAAAGWAKVATIKEESA